MSLPKILVIGLLAMIPSIETVRVKDDLLDVAGLQEEVAGNPLENIVESFRNALQGKSALELKMGELKGLYEQLGEVFVELGFAAAKPELEKNIASFDLCKKDATVRECIMQEANSPTNKKGTSTKPAQLKDPSAAVGLGWSIRIVSFVADMFKGVADGTNLRSAAEHAFDCRIGPTFGNGWKGWGVKKLVRNSLVGGIKSDGDFFASMTSKLGNRDAVKEQMRQFADLMLPLEDAIASEMSKNFLDASEGSLWKDGSNYC